MDKKAAIELSVTAIVILILAIVILGLGLGFIRGMFTKVTTQFEEQIAAEPEPPLASASEPITLSRESIITNAGETEVLKMGAYNPTSGDWASADTEINISCSGLNLATEANIRKIEQGESDIFNILFTIPKTTATQTYLCGAYIGNSSGKYYTKDFIIKIIK